MSLKTGHPVGNSLTLEHYCLVLLVPKGMYCSLCFIYQLELNFHVLQLKSSEVKLLKQIVVKEGRLVLHKEKIASFEPLTIASYN